MEEKETMSSEWIDRAEKFGRVVLWLSLAAACVIVPIEYVGAKRAEARAVTKAEADLQDALRKAEARADGLHKELHHERLTISSMGGYLSEISYASAQGNLWFTNVSGRTGRSA